jgi:hypothetical protein
LLFSKDELKLIREGEPCSVERPIQTRPVASAAVRAIRREAKERRRAGESLPEDWERRQREIRGLADQEIAPPKCGALVGLQSRPGKQAHDFAVVTSVERHGDSVTLGLLRAITPEPDLLLAGQTPPDYVTSPAAAMREEGAAVRPHEIPELTISIEAQERYDEAQAEIRQELDEMPLHERVRQLEAFERKGANVGRELRAVRGKLAEAERKVGLRRAA